MAWQQLSLSDAQQNKYYGFGGWLLFFWLLDLFGVIFMVWQKLYPSPVPAGSPEITWAQVVISVAGTVPFLVLAPLKHRSMPKLTIWAFCISAVLSIAINFRQGIGYALFTLVVSVISIALIQWYLTASKRVNATYRHRSPA